ncbi:MAG: hypothetical protein HY301_07610 [Verrucomicrobia bacterium]|nr:hypothetical protein [Verrucomicrobiota bacterium]
MKRSRRIRLVLLGGLASGTFASCSPPPSISTENVYPNNHHVPGVGYYHAPFRAWYPLPYNQFDAAQQRYYHGGQWDAAPHESITNLSSPTPEAVARAEIVRTDVKRSGFGSSSRGFSTSS